MIGDNSVVPTCVIVKINFNFASVCGLWGLGQFQDQSYFCIRLRFVGPRLFPIQSYKLYITIILCYHNYVPSIFTYLHLCHVYFWLGCLHDQTCRSTINLLVHYIQLCSDFQFRLFNVVMKNAPQWRISNIFARNICLLSNMPIDDRLACALHPVPGPVPRLHLCIYIW